MTNPRVYKGRLFYDGSYTDEFQWVKYDEVKHLLHHEPSAPRKPYECPKCGAIEQGGGVIHGYPCAAAIL